MSLTELTILKNLINNDEYCRKVIPYIESEYFSDDRYKLIYNMVDEYIVKYNNRPSLNSLYIGIDSMDGVESLYTSTKDVIDVLGDCVKEDLEYLLDTTEEWCKERALYNGILESIGIIDDDKGTKDKGEIPKILTEALAVSFDNNVGHDFVNDYKERWEFYHRVEEKIPFGIDKFNKITKGGLSRKTLNIAMAGTGVGKSLFMCDLAASHICSGFNVLYITLEMSEEKIAERIDANLLDTPIQKLSELPLDIYTKRIDRAKSKITGKLIIKEYPTASASTNHFKHLLNELWLKISFKPDVIFIDYLNICTSSRLKGGSNVNSYTYVKSIAEELRGLAVEYNVPLVSATQVNRQGFVSSDFGLEDTSESFGLPATADLMFALISSEEMDDLNQIMIKQLKNRYNDPNMTKRFVVGVDKSKMRLYDVSDSAQSNISNESGGQNYTGVGNNKRIGNVEIVL
mgnify:FL=1